MSMVLPVLLVTAARAADPWEITYQPPEIGASLTVSALEHDEGGCQLGVAERALEPADAPEIPLTSLPRPDAEK